MHQVRPQGRYDSTSRLGRCGCWLLCRFRSVASWARPTGNQSFFGLSVFLTLERLSIPDRLSVLGSLRSPIGRFSFSDRVSMPLRRSFLPRRSLPDRFSPSPMCILLSQTNRKHGGQPNQSGRRSIPAHRRRLPAAAFGKLLAPLPLGRLWPSYLDCLKLAIHKFKTLTD